MIKKMIKSLMKGSMNKKRYSSDARNRKHGGYGHDYYKRRRKSRSFFSSRSSFFSS
ncbi:hypothetical protein [Mesobacillus zeae]|uniref:hypothetical protein n=1 Tax=Mesobacillus zeae TaxID=1917180 RepID=UPI0015E7CECE|nr:hypothetical protein [Mesobacillus zeae]